MELDNASTEELIDELVKREAAVYIKTGPYRAFRLEQKYRPNGNEEIVGDCLLLNGTFSYLDTK